MYSDYYNKAGKPDNWKIQIFDIVNPEGGIAYATISSLPKGDIVYSHGVLHHTGNLDLALKNVWQDEKI